jgi:hypothetical protein
VFVTNLLGPLQHNDVENGTCVGDRYKSKILPGEPPENALPVAGGDGFSGTAVFCRRTVAKCSSNAPSTTKSCACFGRFHGRDGWFRCGGFLRPRRGKVFKQHPKHNQRLCLFRVVFWAGWGVGDNDDQERDSGVYTLQAIMGLSPVGGKRGKHRRFAHMRVLLLVGAVYGAKIGPACRKNGSVAGLRDAARSGA